MVRFLAAFVLLMALPMTAQSDITGQPRVIDGDTLEIQGQRIRLHGIDAPEGKQLCYLDGKRWQCGKDAGNILSDWINHRPVTCEERDKDRYGRIVAVCFVAGENLNAWMVLQGLAVAYRRYSLDYVDQEADAQLARRGVWATRFVLPWEWRRGKRLSQGAANENQPCRIKGNISRKGKRIYHVPGGRWYDRTKISPSKGERWFCSEEEAQAAGWRRAKQ